MKLCGLILRSLIGTQTLVDGLNPIDSNNAEATGKPDYNKEALQKLTEFRLQHRRTIDGRLCAAAFVQDSETFTDCTTTRDPNGTSGKEWCYVEVQLLGKDPNLKNWNYCQPVIDYDFIRSKADAAIKVETNELSRLVTRLVTESSRIDQVVDMYKGVCGPTEVMMGQFEELKSSEAELKRLVEISTKAQGALQDMSEQLKVLKQKHASIEQEAMKQVEKCTPVLEHGSTHGLRVSYFTNPIFRGQPIGSAVDTEVDNVWSGVEPFSGLGSTAYSMIWEGYLEALSTGEYQIGMDTACGGLVYLEEDLILVDRMPLHSGKLTAKGIPIIDAAGEKGRQITTTKQKIHLEGGQFYRIKLMTFHSSALHFKNAKLSVTRLLWAPPFTTDELSLIPRTSLYTSIPVTPLRVSGLDTQRFATSSLANGNLAFWDSTKYFIADLPSHYDQSLWFKWRLNLKAETDTALEVDAEGHVETTSSDDILYITFTFNQPANLYIAVSWNGPFPIVSENDFSVHFQETGDLLSIYEAESRDTKATNSFHYRIFEATIAHGYQQVSLAAKGVLDPQNFVMIFAKPLAHAEPSNMICDDDEVILSDVSNRTLVEGCLESDRYDDEHGCKAAFTLNPNDTPNHIWQSSPSGGIGSFLEIHFTSPMRLRSLALVLSESSDSWPSSLKVEFGVLMNGSPKTTRYLKLTKSHAMFKTPFDLGMVVARSIRISIDDINDQSSEVPIKMAVILKGDPCHAKLDKGGNNRASSLDLKPLGQSEFLELENCTEKLHDFPSLLSNARAPLLGEYNRSIRPQFTCPSSCLQESVTNYSTNTNEAASIPIWGGGWSDSGLYGGQTELCASALHSGVCKNLNKDCAFVLELGPGTNSLSSELKNGLLSQQLTQWTDYSFNILQPPITNTAPKQTQPILISFMKTPTFDSGEHIIVDLGEEYMKQQEELTYGWNEETARISDIKCPKGYLRNSNAVAFSRSVSKIAFDGPERRIKQHISAIDGQWDDDNHKAIHEHIFGPPIEVEKEDTGLVSVDQNHPDGQWAIKLTPGKYHIELLLLHPCTLDGTHTDREIVHPGEATRHAIIVMNGALVVEGRTMMPGETLFISTPIIVGMDELLTLSSPCPNDKYALDGLCDQGEAQGAGAEGVVIEMMRIVPENMSIE